MSLRRVTALAAVLCMIMPFSVSAEDAVTRRDGFLMLWNSIKRPALETRETPFTDVPEGSPGFLEITYAKNRGILDDTDAAFHPDAALSEADGLLWLFRTRNVLELDEMAPEHLGTMLEKYPIASSAGGLSGTLTMEELQTLTRSLDDSLNKEVHEVSLYGEEFEGEGTAFGETFHMNAFTAAHRSFPQNTLVRVTNVRNNKSVVVRINDRGPYVKGRDMDLSLAAFTSIEDRSKGKLKARFERMGDASLAGGCGGEPRYQQRLGRIRLRPGIPQFFTLGKTLNLAANDAFVIRGITYPDGTFVRMQQFITKGEHYEMTPSIEGKYIFLLGDKNNRRRTMEMTVVQCADSPVPERDTKL